MTLNDIETQRVMKAVDAFVQRRRPPAHLRDQVDLSFRIDGQSVELFEVRPRWNSPSEKIEEPIAKATYVKRAEEWRVYWQRADLKWHRYEPVPSVRTVEAFLRVVDKDEYGCFFG